ncbi:MAG: DMT family transporter [Deltaproteobacteria bacterium]|jgi:drug/metabolite transporter (DMT)-like permease|nr:DMT family transporter [Deltaproteobacteria bacterium]
MKTWQADFCIFFSGCLWGMAFIFGRWGLEYCSPALFLLLRFGLAALVAFILFSRTILQTPRRVRREGLTLGVMMGAGYLLQIYSLNFTDVARAAFLTGMSLLGIPIMNFLIFRVGIRINSLVGVVIAVIGLYVFLDPSFKGIASGDIMGLIAIPFWAVFMIYLSAYTEGKTGFRFTCQLLFWQLVGVLPPSLLVVLIFESGIVPPLHPSLAKGLTINPQFLVSLAFCAVMASLVTVLIHTSSQKYTTAVQGMLCLQSESLVGAGAAALILGEAITFHVAVGGAIIIAAILISELGGVWLDKRKAAKEAA